MPFVYVIAEEGSESPIKIGVADDSRTRAVTLQSGNYRLLEVRAEFTMSSRRLAYQIERMAHRHFAEFSIRGEWFDVDDETAIKMLRNCSGRGMRRFKCRQQQKRETPDDAGIPASV